MKALRVISNKIGRFASKKYIIALLIMFIFIITIMEISPIGSARLKQISGGTGMLDMEWGYDQLHVYSMLAKIGSVGRQLYMKLLGLDFIFALVFMLLQSLLITVLLRKAGVNRHWYILNLLPFLRSALDILENCFILVILFNYPIKAPNLIWISSGVTILKWIIYYGVIAVALILGSQISYQAILDKNKKISFQQGRGTI